MKTRVLLTMAVLMISLMSFGQLTGTKNIPGDYPTISNAIQDLNGQGVGEGGVTFNIAAGYTETFLFSAAGNITTQTGSASNPIVFQKSGSGANPLVTAPIGTGTLDAVFSFAGCDYVTFDGIDVKESATNITTTTQMEWGYAILKAGASNGSQYITIKNCGITLNKTNTATAGIYSNNHLTGSTTQLVVSDLNGTNSNLKIYGNTISNCYTGINVTGCNSASPYAFFDQNNEIGKNAANTITNFGGSTVAMNGIYTIYQNNLVVANNSVSGAISGTTAQCTGIQLGSSPNGTLQLYGNTVSIQYSGTTGAFYGIYDNMSATATTSNSVSIYNNTISGCTMNAATSGNCYYLYIAHGGPSSTIHDNIITNNTYGSTTTGATATGTFACFYVQANPTTNGTADVYNNQVTNNARIQSVPGAGSTYLYWLNSTGLVSNVYNNTAINNTTGSTGAAYGFYLLTGSATKNFYGNTLDGILNANGLVYGIYNGNGTTVYIYRNIIRNLTSNAAGSVVYGINFSSLTTNGNAYIYNNFISELKTPVATTASAALSVIGMNLTGSSSVTLMGVYNNTIYLDAVSTGANFYTAGIFLAANVGSNDLRNNIVINKSTPNGTGVACAIGYDAAASIANYSVNSNNNNFYTVGLPGRGIMYDGTTIYKSLQDYKLKVYPKDIFSISENTSFINTATTPYNLHVNTAIPAQVESAGAVVSSPFAITTDIDNEARYPNTGYPVNAGYPTFAPDMGADEFGGIPNDMTPPNIYYTPFSFSAYPGVRNLVATITDPSGVPTSGSGLPRLSWKKSINGTWSYVTGTSLGNNQYNFSFGAGTVLGDTVYYFVLAQDMFTTPSVGSYPYAGATGFSSNPPACIVPPTPAASYVITGPLCGTYTVGIGKNFTTLTEAVNAFNTKEITCPVVFELTDAAYSGETYPMIFNDNPGSSATNTLTIRPAAGKTPVVSGASSDCAFKFNGSKYIIIDGSNGNGSDRSLSLQNNDASALNAVIKITHNGTSAASNLVIKNCFTSTSLAGNFATYGILFDNNTGKGGYSNIVMNNNAITTTRFGVNISGTSTNITSNIRFTNNIIGSNSDATGVARHGLDVQYSDNVLIEGNEIMGQPSGNVPFPIIAGIYVINNCTNVKILKNKVHDWISISTGVSINAFGIVYSIGVQTTGEISDNVVYNIKHPCQSTNPLQAGNLSGIAIGNNVGVLKVYHNTVLISGNFLQPDVATSSSCMSIGTGNTQLDIRNNILKNSAQPSSGTPASLSFAIIVNGNPSIGIMDKNDFFVDGVGPNIGVYNFVNQTTLANWQSATGKDALSLNVNPVFVSASDLRPTSAALNNNGTFIPTVPTDIAGVMRNDPSDMGAYEFGNDPFVTTINANSILSASAVINGSANAAGGNVTTFFDYGITNAYGTSQAANPSSVTGSATTPIQLSVSGLAPSTVYHFRARSVSSTGLTSFGGDSTFTTLAPPPVVITTAATAITGSSASLNGTVNANSLAASVTIEYGLTTSYGNTLTATPASVNSSTPVSVTVPISGLLPNNTYHFRVNATSASGTTNGNDMTFTTAMIPGTVVTLAATNVVGINATLNGTVNANYASANVTFQWGLTAAYGNTATATPASVTGSTTTPVSAIITGLAPATVYHFRCVGTGPGGTSYGADLQFISDCPSPALPGAVTGPQVVCRNTFQVYTVGAISGATGYNWTVPSGTTITAGANTNTITVNFSVTATSGNITVAGTNFCGTGALASLAITVNALPVPTISGINSLCQNTTGVVYTTQPGMTNYLWSVTGGTITAGTGTNAITVTWNSVGAQSVSVNYNNSNGCSAAAPVAYPVTVLPLPVPVITGANVACESSAYLDYTTQAGMTNYQWNMSPNSGTISMSNTNVVTIFWTSPGAKWVSVSYTNANGCTAAAPTVYNVTVNPLPVAPGAVTGTATVCAGATGVAYSVAAVTGATGYAWTLPAGATIASGAGTRSITVNFGATAVSGTISAAAQNACGDGPSSPAFPVVVNSLPSAAGAITGTSTVCQGSTGIAFTVPAIASATSYNWTLPTGATVASGANTNSITVNFSLTAVSGNITVNGVNTCGTGTASTFALTVNVKPATPVITRNGNLITSSAAAGNQWYKNGVAITGATAQTYTILADGTYTDIVTLNGCSSDVSNSIVINHTGVGEADAQVVSVYPNPNKGAFWLTIDSKTAAVYDMQVLNSLGAVVHQEKNLEVNGTFKHYFDLGELSAGMYTIVLRSDTNQITRKIIVNK